MKRRSAPGPRPAIVVGASLAVTANALHNELILDDLAALPGKLLYAYELAALRGGRR